MEGKIAELKDIIEAIKKTTKETGLNVPDYVILEQAIKIKLSREIQIGKEKNISTMNAMKKIDSNKSQSPTQKQIDFLTKHKVKIPETKKEATEIISTYISNMEEEKSNSLQQGGKGK